MARFHSDNEAFLPLLRALAETWQCFEQYAAEDIRRTGLTAGQFDVLCTLGDSEGLTFTELGDRTLIYKTTLTGVVDRLVRSGLAERRACESDRRCVYVRLTSAGQAKYEEVFPAHVEHLKCRLGDLSDRELADALAVLRRMGEAFREPANTGEAPARTG